MGTPNPYRATPAGERVPVPGPPSGTDVPRQAGSTMLNCWSSSFSECEPIAHRLRDRFPDRWVRFHSLPRSRRYASSDRQHRIVLHRANAVLDALARPGEPVVLLTTEFSFESVPVERPNESPHAEWWRSVAKEGSYWHVYATECPYEPGGFDGVLRGAAEDAIGNVMICDAGCDWLFHHYDGGMDVILRSASERDRLRERFRRWLSPHPSGL